MIKAYHVSNNGDDNNTGSRSSPFKTLAKINTLSLGPSDRVFLDRGSVFREDFRPDAKGTHGGGLITVKSYGSGENPIVLGSDQIEVSKWAEMGTGVYCCYQSYVGDICTRNCYLLKLISESEVKRTLNSWHWDVASGKLTVNTDSPISEIENALRTTPILYDRCEYVFHNSIDAGCTTRTGKSSLNSGTALLVWKSKNIFVSQSKVTNAQKHGMGDSNSTNVYWRDVVVDGCLGNNYGSSSATAFFSFTNEPSNSAHYWRDAEATWKAVDGSNNNNTYIAHGSGQDKQRVYRMKGPGVISFNKQTDQEQDWSASDLECERLFLVGDDMFVNRATVFSEVDSRIRFGGDRNVLINSIVSGNSPRSSIQNFGDNNKINGRLL